MLKYIYTYVFFFRLPVIASVWALEGYSTPFKKAEISILSHVCQSLLSFFSTLANLFNFNSARE